MVSMKHTMLMPTFLNIVSIIKWIRPIFQTAIANYSFRIVSHRFLFSCDFFFIL